MKSRLDKCRLFQIPTFHDNRGALSVLEGETFVPFMIRRIFYIYNVSQNVERGGHAHRTSEQFIVCFNGSVAIYLSDGKNEMKYILTNPTEGLYMPPLIWSRQEPLSSETIYVVLSSDHYNSDEYINNLDEYRMIAGE
jgi:dTDP-4-dehydrorhamnose 3,5-epimerase-like enzyme